MADERDPQVSQKYRELDGEEPPRELDQAILAASRHAAQRPHAPLVMPAGRHRWYFPLAAAAVVVLAVAVTVHLERQEIALESPSAAAPAADARHDEVLAAKKAEPSIAPSPPSTAPESAAQRRERSYVPAPPAAQEAQTKSEPVRPEPAPIPPAAASREEARSARDAAPSQSAPQAPPAGAAAESAPKPMAAPTSRLAKLAEQSPERWLEGIAELRRQGRHAEADESFKQFRERYPDYAITDEMKAKVERR